jgi:putative membrane protein
MNNKSKAQNFFSTEEQKRICDTVHSAELKTSGELVPMIVSESHSYPVAPVRGAALVALIASLLYTAPLGEMFWLDSSNLWVFLSLFAPVFCIAHFIINRSCRLKRWFLFSEEMDAEVQNTAVTSFFTERLYKTRDENGILIFISLLEHRAWVIADKGINERIPKEKWQEAVSIITTGIQEKNQCEALCHAIEMIGDILEHEFPVKEDDTNELSDLIIHDLHNLVIR